MLTPGRNLGAVGRDLAMNHVRTPYVAFCDDDSWWEPGRPAGSALRRTVQLARTVPRDAVSLRAFAEAAALPWVLRERRVLPSEVESRLRLLEAPQRQSTARQYTG